MKVSLEDVIDFSLGGDWGKHPDEPLDGYVKVKVIRGTEFANWKKNKASTAALRQIKKTSLEKRELRKGDLIVEVSGGGPTQPVGRIILIDDDALSSSDLPLVCSNFFRQIRLKDGYIPEFIGLIALRDYLGGKIDAYQTSSTNLRNLNFKEFIADTLIPNLPLQEQQNIADTTLNNLENVSVSELKLAKARDSIKKFKQAVIAAATTGKLTEDWRANNVLSADDLTESILKTEEDFPETPSIWTWTVLGEVTNISGGVTKGRDLSGKDVISLPYLRVANVQDGYLDLKEIKKIEIPVGEVEKYLLQRNDILFTEGGDRDKLGRGTIWSEEIDKCIHQNHIFRARLTTDKVLPGFISLATKSAYARSYFFDNASQTVNLASINLTTLKNTPISLPPLEEQEIIMQRVSNYLGIAEKVEKMLEKSESRVLRLRQSILVKIFDEDAITD